MLLLVALFGPAIIVFRIVRMAAVGAIVSSFVAASAGIVTRMLLATPGLLDFPILPHLAILRRRSPAR